MNNFNFGRLFSFLAFLAFAAVSCWATADSFWLSLYPWPRIICWVMAIGFFVVASIGTTMIVNSFNQNIFVENRGWTLTGGIILTLAFWLICSMPTNTHTFFYRSGINGVAKEDITTTAGYLEQLKSFSMSANYKIEKINKLRNDVEMLLGELEGEIMNEANPGFGPKSKDILRKFAVLFEVPKIEPLSVGSANRRTIADAYRQKIYSMRDAKIREIDNEQEIAEAQIFKPLASENLVALYNARTAIENKDLDLNNAEQAEELNKVLNDGYSTIKTYANFVSFNGDDEAFYTAEKPITKVKSMISVFNVWKDMLTSDKYRGHGLWFWVVISILIDVAAFIFFDLTFARRAEDF